MGNKGLIRFLHIPANESPLNCKALTQLSDAYLQNYPK